MRTAGDTPDREPPRRTLVLSPYATTTTIPAASAVTWTFRLDAGRTTTREG